MFRDEHMNPYTILHRAQLLERFGSPQGCGFPFQKIPTAPRGESRKCPDGEKTRGGDFSPSRSLSGSERNRRSLSKGSVPAKNKGRYWRDRSQLSLDAVIQHRVDFRMDAPR